MLAILFAIPVGVIVAWLLGVRVTFKESIQPPFKWEEGRTGCTLMRERSTGNFGCYGCAGVACGYMLRDWEPHSFSPGYAGTPYVCLDTPDGCVIAR